MTQTDNFFLNKAVKERKDYALKNRLQTLVKRLGKSEADFYQELGLTKQYWYGISWGILETPLDVKIKISRGLDTDTSLIWLEVKE